MAEIIYFYSTEGLFKNLTGSVSASSETFITPAGWTFSTWGIIYAWQALWIVFNIVLIFIKGPEGRYYNNPPVLTIWFHIFILINFILNIVWLFIWDNKDFTVSIINFLLASLLAFHYFKNKKGCIYCIIADDSCTLYCTCIFSSQ